MCCPIADAKRTAATAVACDFFIFRQGSDSRTRQRCYNQSMTKKQLVSFAPSDEVRRSGGNIQDSKDTQHTKFGCSTWNRHIIIDATHTVVRTVPVLLLYLRSNIKLYAVTSYCTRASYGAYVARRMESLCVLLYGLPPLCIAGTKDTTWCGRWNGRNSYVILVNWLKSDFQDFYKKE